MTSGTLQRDSRPVWWKELAGGLAVFGVYAVGTSLDWPGRHAVAMANSRRLFDLERALHLDVEHPLNGWLVPHGALRVAANYEYAVTYVVTAFGLLIWLFLRHPATYRWARTSFILVNLVGVACFAVYPLAPPRLVPELGFVDTVLLGHTWGSWGSAPVSHANQLAAMPSLHVAWALWVTLVLVRVSGAQITQALSGLHVLLTVVVIMATANHYLLDAVAGAALAVVCVALTRPVPDRVDAADAFFVHVESPAAPQHAGAVVLLDLDNTAAPFGAWRPDQVRDVLVNALQTRLAVLPRFRQRLSAPSRWRRPRWVDHPELDWDWHVPEVRLSGEGGEGELRAVVAELVAQPLPRDRPLWRFVVVPSVGPHRAAVILLVHHVVADGIGIVAQALTLLEPALPPRPATSARPGPVRAALATIIGLGQLATDGRPAYRFPSSRAAQRRYGMVELLLDDVKAVARQHRVRVTDVLLSAVVGGMRRMLADTDHDDRAWLRTAVPITVRDVMAGGAPRVGNATAAVMIDLPLGPAPEPERLVQVAAQTRRLRTGTRVLASRFVMHRVGAALPAPAHAWFARQTYGGRFFQAIMTNMPGPDIVLRLYGRPVPAAYPIVPLAPGTALAVGALGWHGSLCIGVSTDPAVIPDADKLAAAIAVVIDELRAST